MVVMTGYRGCTNDAVAGPRACSVSAIVPTANDLSDVELVFFCEIVK